MKIFLLFYLLNSAYLYAYQTTTKCKAEFSTKQWRTFQNAKALMKELSIKTKPQFHNWSRSGQRPDDFPSNPNRAYKTQWVSWGEFLGTGNVAKKNFRNYESAKELMKELGIKTRDQFKEWSRSEQRPNDFPSNPSRVYKTKWVSWGEFLGTEKTFRSYESAKALMKELSIKTHDQFKEWSRSGQRPQDFPSNPIRVYKKRWVNWGEFLGTGNVRWKVFRSYESAKAFMKELSIKTHDQFKEWSRSGQRPDDFPSDPARVYKKRWVNWGEFLGTGNVQKKIFRSYESAKTLMKELGIKTQNQFREWNRTGQRPSDFPSNPNKAYKEKWVNWGEFLGRQKPKQWMSYRKGQRHVQKMGIRTIKEFLEWIKSNERLEDFPPNPHIVWSKSWKSVQDFLKVQWVSFQKARSYVQLGNVTNKSEYYELRELEDLMDELPPNPATVYAPYWKGWDHFLWDMELSDALAN